MNRVKNIIYTLVLAFILTATLDVHAATFMLGITKGTTDPDSYIVTDKATLTINKVSSSDSFIAYKIIDVFYNTKTNVVTYEFTTGFTILGSIGCV